MPVIRSSEIPAQEIMGTRLEFLAGPATGASEVVAIRGVVSAGATFPAHSHDHEEVLYFLSGSGTYTIGEDTSAVSAGDVIVVPSGVLHDFETAEGLDAIGILPAGTKTFAPDGSELSLGT